jgi:hypothetical protein
MEKIMDKEKLRKKLDNFWYYYKFHTFAAIFILIVLTVLVYNFVARVEPDVTIMIVTQNTVATADDETAMGTYLGTLTKDVNNDGKKVVECDFKSISDPQVAQAAQVQLAASFSSNENIIYIFDDSTMSSFFKDQMDGSFLKINTIFPDEKSSDPYKLPISDTTLDNQSFSKGFSGLNIYVKNYTTKQNNKNINADIQNQLNIIKKLTAK